MINLSAVLIGIVGLIFSYAARAEFPGLLIDYTRLQSPHGVTDLPPRLLERVPASRTLSPVANAALALRWVVIDEHGAVSVRLEDSRPHDLAGGVKIVRSLTLGFESLDDYARLVKETPAIAVNQDVLRILRERRREVGLSSEVETSVDHSALLPRILQDQGVLRQLPAGMEWFKFSMRSLELQPEGRVRLSLTGVADGESFHRAVHFDSLEAFNRASGENVRAEDFARPLLSFWLLPERMSGRYLMKTRAEIARQCPDLLAHGIRASVDAPPGT